MGENGKELHTSICFYYWKTFFTFQELMYTQKYAYTNTLLKRYMGHKAEKTNKLFCKFV